MPRKSSKVIRECFISERPQYSFKENVHKKVCQDLPADYEHEGQYYCVLHFPNDQKHKNTDFKSVFQARLDNQENNFQYVYFPDRVYLLGHDFNNEVKFLGCTFLQNVDFVDLVFHERADFSNTIFTKDIGFARVKFTKNVYFSNAVFEASSEFTFLSITIEEKVYLKGAVFRGDTIFDDFNTLNNKNVRLHLDDARAEKADRIYFKNSRLSPNWFVNVNSRKFIFHNIDWENANEAITDTKAEIKLLKDCKIYPQRNRLLTITCRQLADNYEENSQFEQASNFRQIANESKRLGDYKGFKIWSLHWWYWLSSFYGESWKRALTILFVILFTFALIYTQTNFQNCPKDEPVSMSLSECKNSPLDCKCQVGGLNVKEATSHSLATAIFQNVEYRKPVTVWGELTTYLEKILAPLQAALLALAIRRKFMR